MDAKQTSLIDLLESVPRDAVLAYEHDQFSSSFRTVGRLCHEAAAALRANAAALEEAAGVCEELDEEASWKEGRLASGHECATAIRAMKEQA